MPSIHPDIEDDEGWLRRLTAWLTKKPTWLFPLQFAALLSLIFFCIGIPLGIALCLQEWKILQKSGWHFHEGVLSIAFIGAALGAGLGIVGGTVTLILAPVFRLYRNARDRLLRRAFGDSYDIVFHNKQPLWMQVLIGVSVGIGLLLVKWLYPGAWGIAVGVVIVLGASIVSARKVGELISQLRQRPCPQCGKPLGDKKFGPRTRTQYLWGGWTCPECGCDVDRLGQVRLK